MRQTARERRGERERERETYGYLEIVLRDETCVSHDGQDDGDGDPAEPDGLLSHLHLGNCQIPVKIYFRVSTLILSRLSVLRTIL